MPVTTNILAGLGALVLILQTAILIPDALTDLLRSYRQALLAVRDLRTTLATHRPDTHADRDRPLTQAADKQRRRQRVPRTRSDR